METTMATTKRRTASSSGECEVCGRKHRALTPEQCKDRRMTEKSLQARVIYRAKRRGWVVAHVGRGYVGGDGGRFVTPMSAGWPDLVLFKPGMPHPVLAMELKREQGVVADLQWDWLALFNECGIPAVIVKPSDLREGRVDAILEGR
jgi:hypothetical protein